MVNQSIIDVTILKSAATESGSNNLVYTFTRTGDISSSLNVNFTVAGTASSADFMSSIDLSAEPTVAWTKLLGTNRLEESTAITLGLDGSVYIGGYTNGRLGDNDGVGYDAFIAKYLPDGTREWKQSLGTGAFEVATSLTTGLDGAIYVSGETYGNLYMQPNSGGADAFITKYSIYGEREWTKLLGTSSHDIAKALTIDLDGFIYVSGVTYGNLNSQINNGNGDAFIAKLSPDNGSIFWTKLLGSSSAEYAYSLTTGLDGSVYVSGYTGGNLDGKNNNGGDDGFISKYLADGTKEWTQLLGSNSSDYAYALATGRDGAVYVSGVTGGDLGGLTNGGYRDAFISKFLSDGTHEWTNLLGGYSDDGSYAIATGLDGGVYIAGYTIGNLGSGLID
jgi:hypothetical protein